MNNVVEQKTEMDFKVHVVVPWNMPCAFMQEFYTELEKGLIAKAQEIAKSWDERSKAEVTIDY